MCCSLFEPVFDKRGGEMNFKGGKAYADESSEGKKGIDEDSEGKGEDAVAKQVGVAVLEGEGEVTCAAGN
jgi:hypothetical protein